MKNYFVNLDQINIYFSSFLSKRNFFNTLSVMILLFALLGCTSTQNVKIENVDFSNIKSLKGSFVNFIIKKNFIKKLENPYIDYYVPEKLSDIIIKWGEKRFESKDPDSSNTIVLNILKANTLAFPLNTEEKIEDLWNSPASLKLEMYIEVYIELLDDKGVEIAYCEVKAFRSKVLREDISLEERDFQIQEMTKSIFNDFDRLAVEKIKDVFRDYII